MQALVNVVYRDRLAALAASEVLASRGFSCGEPVWDEAAVLRPWLVQVQVPASQSAGVVPTQQAFESIRRVAHLHDGIPSADAPEEPVIPNITHATRPGGAPFVGRLPQSVVRAYERQLRGGSEIDGDLPLFHDETEMGGE